MTKPGPKPKRRTMLPDDPRHGTTAGANAHYAARVPLCQPCKDSRREYQKTRPKQKRDHKAEYARKKANKPAVKKVDWNSLPDGDWVLDPKTMTRRFVPVDPEEFEARRAA